MASTSPPSNIVSFIPSSALFVGVSATADANTLKVMTSNDGEIWALQTTPADTFGNYWSLAHSPELNRVIATKNGNGGTNGSHSIYTEDGVTWDAGPEFIPNHQISGDTLWVPELSKFISGTGVGSGSVWTSGDGITHTQFAGHAGSSGYSEMEWSAELGYGIEINSGDGHVYTTPTFEGSWTDLGLVAPAGISGSSPTKSLLWVSERSLFVYIASTGIYTSPTGLVWTQRQVLAGVSRGCLAWSSNLGRAVCVGAGPANFCYTSEDLLTWTSRTIQNLQWIAVARSETIGLFAAITLEAVGSNKISTSPDGITWTAQSTPSDSNVVWVNIIAAEGFG